MASSHGCGGQPHDPCSDEHAAAAAAGPQLDVGEHDLLAPCATSGLEATNAFQQAPAPLASGSTTCHQFPQALSSSVDGHDDTSRNFCGAQNAGRTPESNPAKRHKPHGLAGGERSNTLVQLRRPPSPHTFLAATIEASSTSEAAEMPAGGRMQQGLAFGASALRLPLSAALGQADAAGAGYVGGVGTAQEVEVSTEPGTGESGSSFAEVYGQQQYLRHRSIFRRSRARPARYCYSSLP